MSIAAKPSPILPPLQQPAKLASVTAAIRKAADTTGASFEYLIAAAKVESNLNPNLKARGSSATGLFQFIEQTWFGMIKQAGAALGLSRYADAITRTSSGRYQVADSAVRNEILQLRKNAAANAAMAGIFTQHNAAALGKQIGRAPTDGELYVAHFFGAGGAAKIINATANTPHANAAKLFPAAARANRSIFYDRQGEARSIAGVYAELNRRFQVARASTAAPTTVVANVPATTRAPASDAAGTTKVLASASAQANDSAVPGTVPPAGTGEPMFRSLFLPANARGAVAPVVAQLWGVSTAQRAAEAPLDLFQDLSPNVRALFNRSA